MYSLYPCKTSTLLIISAKGHFYQPNPQRKPEAALMAFLASCKTLWAARTPLSLDGITANGLYNPLPLIFYPPE